MTMLISTNDTDQRGKATFLWKTLRGGRIWVLMPKVACEGKAIPVKSWTVPEGSRRL